MAKGNPRVTAALAKLAVMRQAVELSETDFELFASELDAERIAPELAIEACRRLGRTPRQPGHTAFPDFGTILAECSTIRRECYEQERAEEQRRMLAAPPPPPVSKERFEEIFADVRRMAAARRMPEAK